MIYEISYTETLHRMFYVKADDEESARNKVYDELEEDPLTDDDYTDCDMEIIGINSDSMQDRYDNLIQVP